jgi:hypothetical protein
MWRPAQGDESGEAAAAPCSRGAPQQRRKGRVANGRCRAWRAVNCVSVLLGRCLRRCTLPGAGSSALGPNQLVAHVPPPRRTFMIMHFL